MMKHFTIVILFLLFTVSYVAAAPLPEWDGVYIKLADGTYKECEYIKDLTFNGTSSTRYFKTDIKTEIPTADFKGILIKGVDLVKQFKIFPLTRDKAFTIKIWEQDKQPFTNEFIWKLDYIFVEENLKRRTQGDNIVYIEPAVSAIKTFNTINNAKYIGIYYPTKGQTIPGQLYVIGIKD